MTTVIQVALVKRDVGGKGELTGESDLDASHGSGNFEDVQTLDLTTVPCRLADNTLKGELKRGGGQYSIGADTTLKCILLRKTPFCCTPN